MDAAARYPSPCAHSRRFPPPGFCGSEIKRMWNFNIFRKDLEKKF